MPYANENQSRYENRLAKLNQVAPLSYTFGVEIEFTTRGRLNSSTIELKLKNKWTELFYDIPRPDFESQSYNHRNSRTIWKIVPDATCGYELVTPILRGLEGLETLKRVLQCMTKLQEEEIISVNSNCGIHVHLGTRNLSIDDIKKFVSNYIRRESAIDLLMPLSRRGNRNTWCHSNMGRTGFGSPRNNNEHFESVSYTMSHVKNFNAPNKRSLSRMFDTRYVKVNTNSMSNHGTIEIRHHSGSLNPTKITNWILILDYILRMSRTQQAFKNPTSNRYVESKGNFREFIRWFDCAPELQTYMKERKQELQRAESRQRRNSRRRRSS